MALNEKYEKLISISVLGVLAIIVVLIAVATLHKAPEVRNSEPAPITQMFMGPHSDRKMKDVFEKPVEQNTFKDGGGG